MWLSRDVNWTRLNCAVWPLEGVKVDYIFSDIFMNISKTVLVGVVKFF